MKQNQQKAKRIFVGYDLTEHRVNISYCQGAEGTPITVSSVVGGNKTSLPLVLCKWKGIEQWCYGDEAKRVAGSGDVRVYTGMGDSQ